MRGVSGRLTRLRGLLNLESRVADLEARNDELQGLLGLEDRVAALEARNRKLRERLHRQSKLLDALRKRSNNIDENMRGLRDNLQTRIRNAEHRLDMLKSSLEVPREMVDGFHDWKARNPVPERPLVSVIVATYNRARLLTERCIPSVLGQSYENLELLVVGDHCTDGTEEALSRINDPRLRFVNLPERGAYPEDPERRWMVAGTPAMNEGLKMSSGHFITHLDDDDEYTLDRLEKLVAFAVGNACDFVWHGYWWENDAGEWREIEAPDFEYSQVTTSSIFYRSWFKNVPWDINSHRLGEPGDWNRLRKIKYIDPVSMRYPEALLKHYRQKSQG